MQTEKDLQNKLLIDALAARVAQLENGYSQILSEISTTSHAENYKLLDVISRALEAK
jgi:hypothetical protein